MAVAHVIRFVGATHVVSKEHLHEAEFQMIYVLKGSMVLSFEGHGNDMDEGRLCLAAAAQHQAQGARRSAHCWRSSCRRTSRLSSSRREAARRAALMDAKTDTPAAAEMVARARAMIPALRKRAAQAQDRRIAKETIAEMQEGRAVPRCRSPSGGPAPTRRSPPTSTRHGAGRRRHVGRLGLRRGRHPSVGPVAVRRPRREPMSGQGSIDADLFVADAVRNGRNRSPAAIGSRGLVLRYSSGCEHCDWRFRRNDRGRAGRLP